MVARKGEARYTDPRIVTLACGHQLKTSILPQVGLLVFCVQCDKPSHRPFDLKRDVDGKPILGEWRWHCRTSSGCNCGRQVSGASRENAFYAASRHSQRFPRHDVWLINPQGHVVDRWGSSTFGAGEPLWKDGVASWKDSYGVDGDIPPF